MDTSEAIKSVGVREFRQKLAELLLLDQPIAVTKHGLTVGYYIPTHQSVSEADKRSLEEAAARLHDLLAARGIDPETLVEEAKEARRRGKSAPHV